MNLTKIARTRWQYGGKISRRRRSKEIRTQLGKVIVTLEDEGRDYSTDFIRSATIRWASVPCAKRD
jgi:hypothetical protein